jgi:hypothetical protein
MHVLDHIHDPSTPLTHHDRRRRRQAPIPSPYWCSGASLLAAPPAVPCANGAAHSHPSDPASAQRRRVAVAPDADPTRPMSPPPPFSSSPPRSRPPCSQLTAAVHTNTWCVRACVRACMMGVVDTPTRAPRGAVRSPC